MSELQDLFNSAIEPLPEIHDKSFASHFDTFAGKQVILLGDGSHGTSEFYSARAEITKRLIERHGYTMVAVEADWPDAKVIDRYVRLRPGPKAQIGGTAKGYEPFNRFPTWMWRNVEMLRLVEWMRDRNHRIPPEKRAGFYGLDLYSMGASIDAVIDYLDCMDPKASKQARLRYGCLEPWIEEPTSYGLASLRGMEDCEGRVVKMLRDLLEKRLEYAQSGLRDADEYHSGEQNAHLVRDAEKYYKTMYYSSVSSWNLRDIHMFETLERLLRFNEGQKAIV
jgi:erythromycin esterase-like protein